MTLSIICNPIDLPPKKSFKNKPVPLQGTASFSAGEICALFGPSGSGKTTLLNVIAGLLTDTSTTLTFQQQDWQTPTYNKPSHQRKVAYTFQDARLLPHLSVADNFKYAEKRRYNNTHISQKECVELLGLASLLNRKPNELSGGQRQRVAITQSLLMQPNVLLLDEALANLDWTNKLNAIHLVQTYVKRTKAIVIFSSHNLDEICQFVDTLLLIKDGHLQTKAPLSTLLPTLSEWQNDAKQNSALIDCTVTALNKDFNLIKASFDEGTLTILNSHLQPGTHIRVRIPAKDVSISLSKATDSSILNILKGTITTITDSDNGRCFVQIQCGKALLISSVTKKSVQTLKLKPLDTVYAQVKSIALPTYLEPF